MSRSGARAAAILVLLGLLGWHVHARSKPAADLNAADRLLLSATGPVQDALSGLVVGSGNILDHYFLLVGVSRENERLLEELQEARGAVAELVELRSENDRLRSLVTLRDRVPGQVIAASVVGRGTSARFRTLRIDRGKDDSIAPGMAVLARSGAVGHVLRASGGFADVLLLTDGLSAAGAIVQSSRLRGVALGGSGEFLQLGFVRRSDAAGLATGDLVITSGEDGVFPEGVAIGVVRDSRAPDTGLFLEIELEPAVDLARVDEVLVVLDRGAGPFSTVQSPEADAELGSDSDGATSTEDALR